MVAPARRTGIGAGIDRAVGREERRRALPARAGARAAGASRRPSSADTTCGRAQLIQPAAGAALEPLLRVVEMRARASSARSTTSTCRRAAITARYALAGRNGDLLPHVGDVQRRHLT